MKVQGVVLLCCILLAKGQAPPAVEEDHDTTTPKPPPTTSATTTTTEVPTTPPQPPKTTTPVPTTTSTTAKPAPAPPTPSPSVPAYPKNIGKWFVNKEKDNTSTCIALKGAIQITVIGENKTQTEVNVPPFATATGSCDDPQVIHLSWDSPVVGKENSLTLYFEKNSTKATGENTAAGISNGKYALQNVHTVLYLTSSSSPKEGGADNIAVFQTHLNHSYSCLAEEVIKSPSGNFTLKIREVQLEAFRQTPPGHSEFSSAEPCPADDATDVVPIAVGAALAGLVVIVLIAYLIGRKRSRARGYQSV